MKRAIILPSLVTAFVALSPAGVALADDPHSAPPAGSGGQPSVSEDPATSPPGHSSGGFTTHAQTVYANPASTGSQGGTSSGNPHVVSQYDIAGIQFCTHRGTC
jgi:hypothetical protein